MAHPFVVIVGGIIVQQGMLGGQDSIAGPAVLLPVGAVRGEMVEVCQGGDLRHPLQLVDHLIRAMEAALVPQVGIHDPVGQQISRCLFLRDAADQGIAEAVVGKGRTPDFLLTTLAGIFVLLDVQGHLQIFGPDEPEVVHSKGAVFPDVFAEDHGDLLARLALDLQQGHTGAVLTKVVEIAAECLLMVGNGQHRVRLDCHRSQLPGADNGMSLTDHTLSPGGIHGNGRSPAAVVKAGQVPSGDLQPGIIEFTLAQLIGNGGRRRAAEGSVRFQFRNGTVAVGQLQAYRQLGGRPPGCLVKIPDIATEAVLHTVAQLEAQYIFPGLKHPGQVVHIIVDHIIGGGNVGGQMAPGQLLAVEPEAVKAQAADGQLCIRDPLPYGNVFPQIGRRNAFIQGTHFRCGRNKGTGQFHKTASFLIHFLIWFFFWSPRWTY